MSDIWTKLFTAILFGVTAYVLISGVADDASTTELSLKQVCFGCSFMFAVVFFLLEAYSMGTNTAISKLNKEQSQATSQIAYIKRNYQQEAYRVYTVSYHKDNNGQYTKVKKYIYTGYDSYIYVDKNTASYYDADTAIKLSRKFGGEVEKVNDN